MINFYLKTHLRFIASTKLSLNSKKAIEKLSTKNIRGKYIMVSAKSNRSNFEYNNLVISNIHFIASPVRRRH